MNIGIVSAKEAKVNSDAMLEKLKKKDRKNCLKIISKKIKNANRQGHFNTLVYIDKYLEEYMLPLLKKKGYEVEQIEDEDGFYLSNPPYIVSWEDKGE